MENTVPSFEEHIDENAVYSINHHTVTFPKIKSSEEDKAIATKIEKIISKLLGDKFKRVLIEADNHVPSFEEHLNEAELETVEIDKSEFPNPITGIMKKIFHKKGKFDGAEHDDDVKTVPVSIQADKLKPSQDAIYLSKTLSMAVGGVEGGDLGAIISKDNYILDGHHRWAATMFNNPKAKVKGYQADLNIGDLIPVLRALGDAFGNERRGEPKGGDVNIFNASDKDIEAALAGQNMNMKFYKVEKGEEWMESKGGLENVGGSLAKIQATPPPSDAEPRKEMPVIDPDKGEVKKAAKLLNRGAVDVRAPYADKKK